MDLERGLLFLPDSKMGRKTVVLDAPSADYFLVSARSGGQARAAHGVSLFLVGREAAGLALLPYRTQSGGRAADVGLNEVALEATALIGAAGEGLAIVERAVDKGIAALCAEAVGIIAALNEATLNYLKTRKQFGVPIGKFQALQHRMAKPVLIPYFLIIDPWLATHCHWPPAIFTHVSV